MPSMRYLCFLSFWAGLMIVSATSPLAAVEIVGHRGASHDAPENTLSSVNLAWERNSDAVEIDIYLTRDGKIVAFHDKTTKRIGGRDQKVGDQTLAELQTLDVGAWKNAQYRNERIPTLPQILQTIPAGKRLFIEIKCGPEVLPQLKADLAASGKTADQTALIGFDYDTMRKAKELLPDLKAYWVFMVKQNKVTRKFEHNADYYIQKAKEANFDGLDVGYNGFLTADFIQKSAAAGLPVFVWTINDVKDAKKLVEMGITGITTDRPGLMMETFKQAE
ncbi:putative glycerophosphoryl diester phosphodiesterase 1 [Gimesia panareensis]|uniref:Putative glycerophosphoryl diester phosphodiesterase 1 n=1 Tax=Gimesia panareensis TaxID=2527978 RepID=A0A517ZZC1_9PLAN|nr:putative glycerophosphoryl diester phosphodiesterase 1 [Gimesia panareensis]QDU47826.1 putative glycerophosphoryl diester phosphodiesterase 1 [Gimesia panareensis]